MDIDGKKEWRLLTYQEYSFKVNAEDLQNEDE